MKKIDECLYICTKSTGCILEDTHRLCKINNENSYTQLHKHFLS